MATINEISKLIESSNSKLIASINKVNSDLKADIQKLSLNVSEKFTSLYKDVELLQQRCDAVEDMVKRQDRRKEVIVRNIPVLKDESIATIVKSICSVINFQSPYGVPVAFRLRGATVKAGESRMTRSKVVKGKSVQYPSIILKFATDYDATVFMDLYYLKASLKLSDVGFNSEDRIYIAENLSPANFAIFRLAREMKNAGSVIKVRTRNGIVSVQLCGDSPKFVPINHIRDLDAFAMTSDIATNGLSSA